MKLILYIYLILFFALLYSCGLGDEEEEENVFDSNLRGIWETTKTINGLPSQLGDSLYAKIIIEYRYITLIGNLPHFKNFTQNNQLDGYSSKEDSLIYVKDKDEWQSPVPYRVWGTGTPKVKMLTLKNKGTLPDETFKWIGE